MQNKYEIMIVVFHKRVFARLSQKFDANLCLVTWFPFGFSAFSLLLSGSLSRSEWSFSALETEFSVHAEDLLIGTTLSFLSPSWQSNFPTSMTENI